MNTKEPIRILQCVSNMDRAGIETILMNFYRNIDKNKIQFDFLVNKSKPGAYDSEIKKLGGKIFITPGLNPFRFNKYKEYMKNLFKEHPEYKIIHCQNEMMGYYALKVANECDIPVRIAHAHSTKIERDYKYIIKLFCKNKLKKVANYKVACSKLAGKFLFNENTKVINNAIDSEKFSYNEKLRKLTRDELKLENKIVIGHIGRFTHPKNHEYLIDIFYECTKIKPNVVLILVGDGELKNKIRKKVYNYGIEEKVIFIDNTADVNPIYQAMDIFVLPSFNEGLPVVGIEAQAAGLPCIISNRVTSEVDVTGNVEFISLDEGPKIWAKRILAKKDFKRKNEKEAICNNGYDIKIATQELTDWYIKLYMENNYENCNDWT